MGGVSNRHPVMLWIEFALTITYYKEKCDKFARECQGISLSTLSTVPLSTLGLLA